MMKSPFSLPNIRLFIAFRIFFNARFYYPVFTILFLDYGLTIEQFALLNSVWAITIVCAEVPSGALADLLGRKRLLVLTAALMIVEIAVIAFVPLSHIRLVFWAFLINRVLSGLAEAMASGADEAIAYDSLVREGLEKSWPRVLSVQMRLHSLAAIILMTVGALVYDPDSVNRMVALLGSTVQVSQQDTIRFPIYLTLVLALLALATTLKMQESARDDREKTVSRATIRQALALTINAGIWIMKTPFGLVVILFAMLYDHVLRMIITLVSKYFREIGLPEASFGLIMALLSLLGLIVPKGAEYMAGHFSPARNGLIMALLTFATLFGLAAFPTTLFLGVLPIAAVTTGLMLTSFLTSHYLNMITPSRQRATVLSFKGLSLNLAYGMIGILFTLAMKYHGQKIAFLHPGWQELQIKSSAFQVTIGWFPGYTALLILPITLFSLVLLRGTGIHLRVPKRGRNEQEDGCG